MVPDATWDARMMLDWLDDLLKTDIYYICTTFVRAQTVLERMKTEDPEQYDYFTASGTWGPEYYQMCREMAATMEAAGERGRFLRTRLREQVLAIEQDVQTLSAGGGELFGYEKARLSERIREATDALISLRGNIGDYSVTQIAEVDRGMKLLDGDLEASDGERDILFARWIMAVLDSEDGPREARVQASSVVSTGTNTRMYRMAAGGRVLEADSRDESVIWSSPKTTLPSSFTAWTTLPSWARRSR